MSPGQLEDIQEVNPVDINPLCNLVIKDLPYYVCDIELKEEFQRFGRIQSVKCNKGAHSYVAFYTESDAQKALKQMDGSSF